MTTVKKDSQIVILGMTDNIDRYAFMAYEKLKSHDFHNLVGVTPKEVAFEDIKIVPTLKGVQGKVHTLTLYVGSKKLDSMIEDILALHPERIICNPGTENSNLIHQAQEQGIDVVIGCTLVMLASDQF